MLYQRSLSALHSLAFLLHQSFLIDRNEFAKTVFDLLLSESFPILILKLQVLIFRTFKLLISSISQQ